MKCADWEEAKKPWKSTKGFVKRCDCRRTFYYAEIEESSYGPGFEVEVFNSRHRSEETRSAPTLAEAKSVSEAWLQNLCQQGSPDKLTKFKYHTKRGEFRGGCACNRSRGRSR